jgi:hypothetical protein
MVSVFEVLRNSDMTEGRGPMVYVATFTTNELAWEYANSQGGVMGRSNYGDWRTYSGGRDWDVKEKHVHSSMENFDKKLKVQKALDKLTAEDKVLLGLL